jgi:FKBP-type peptidyl-prolyl cis-trans isomerase FkpA
MKKVVTILTILAAGLVGCQQFKTGDGGLQYQIHTDKDGPTIKPGDFVALKALYKTDADSVMYNSADFDLPTSLTAVAPQFKGDFNTGLALLSEGDSATIKVNLDTMTAIAKKSGGEAPPFKGKYVVYVVKIVKVIPKDTAHAAEFQAKIQTFFKSEVERAKNTEAAKVKNYIAEKNLKPTTTPSGLAYVVTTMGTGAKPVKGDSVLVNYSVSFLTGKVFDTNIPALSKTSSTYNPGRPYEPIPLPYGSVGGIIPGVEEALSLFPMGTKVTLILPSKLGYGAQGGAIPPYTPLIFEMEELKIIPGKPGAATAVVPPAAPVVK